MKAIHTTPVVSACCQLHFYLLMDAGWSIQSVMWQHMEQEWLTAAIPQQTCTISRNLSFTHGLMWWRITQNCLAILLWQTNWSEISRIIFTASLLIFYFIFLNFAPVYAVFWILTVVLLGQYHLIKSVATFVQHWGNCQEARCPWASDWHSA